MDYSPPSPLSSPSPQTPDWVKQQEREEAIRRKREERERKETYIRLVLVGLDKFPKTDNFVSFLTTTLRSNIDLDKRYSIANALNTIIENKNLDNDEVRAQTRTLLRTNALDMESSLYHALNYQRNLFAITFFGAMGGIRCNYSRTLQTVHKQLQDETNQQANYVSQDNASSIEINRV